MSRRTGHDDGDGARRHGPGLALAWIALAGFGLGVGCESAVPGGQARVDADRGDADMAADADMEPVDMQPIDMALPCDDAEVGSPCSVGRGACLVWGTLACGEDGLMFCDAEAGQPGDEVCNGDDDDCDGEADEKLTQTCYSGPEGTEGAGICRVGMRSCVDGLFGACEGEVVPQAGDRCDGRDEDCDGEVDEDERMVACYAGPAGTEGVGACRGGTRTCIGGALGACAGEVLPEAVDRCDGRDEDCDGEVDEDEQAVACYAGPAGTEGVGTCRPGVRACVDGALGACAGEVLPEAVDRCDGRDEDCDGEVDEDERTVACYAGPPGTDGVGTCRAGTRTCVDGALGGCEGEVLPEAADVCDGRDEDCNGGDDVDADGALVCGQMVADYCRVWLGWTDQENYRPGVAGDDYPGAILARWGDCGMLEHDQEGNLRCTNTSQDGRFHTMEFPLGRNIDADHVLGIRFDCDLNRAPEHLVTPLLAVINGCRVSVGLAAFDTGPVGADGEAGSPTWGVCADANGRGRDGLLHCNTTDDASNWRPIMFGRVLSATTDVGVAFACDAGVVEDIVEAQTRVWLGWAQYDVDYNDDMRDRPVPRGQRPDERAPPEPATWGTCPGQINPSAGLVRCVSTNGDGLYHKLDIGEPVGPAGPHGGWLGISLSAGPGGQP